MKRVILLIGFICLVGFANAQITFQRTYELGGCEGATAIQQTEDGGFIVAGYYAGSNIFFMKLNSNGDTIWVKKIIGVFCFANSVQLTKDGYIISGYTSYGAGGDDILIIKTDINGNILWSRTYGGIKQDFGGYLQQTIDGGFIITGSTCSFGAGVTNVYLIKTDINGNVEWAKTFGGTGSDYGYSVNQTSDGGYIVTGETQSFGVGSSSNVYLIKTDANGNLIWSKTFGGSNADAGNSVQQTTDGGYIITGYTVSFGLANSRAYLIKTDTNGNLLWSKYYSDTLTDSQGFSVQQTQDKGFIISGTGFVGSLGLFLLRTDSSGNVLWAQTYGGIDGYECYCFDKTSDNGFILGGYAHFQKDTASVYLIKTNSYGNSGCEPTHPQINTISPPTQVSNPTTISSQGDSMTSPHFFVTGGAILNILCSTASINEFDSNSGLNIYPNPASDVLTVSSSMRYAVSSIEIFNLLGEKIYNTPITDNRLPVTINIADFPSGVYVVRVRMEKGVAVSKFIKE